MQSYAKNPHRATPDRCDAAHPLHATALDPRVEAFAELLRSVDARDWRAGQAATRQLRALGYSVCLTRPAPETPPPSEKGGRR